MKRYAIVGFLSLALLGLAVLLSLPSASSVGQGPGKKSDKAAPATLAKLAGGLPVEKAEQAEAEGEFETALKHYTELKKSRPNWAPVRLRIAACQAALDKNEDAAGTLRELLKMKSASPEVLAQAWAALQELLLQKLSGDQQQEWKQAVSLIQAGEELKQHENEDPEIRTEHKLYAGPYQKAIRALEKLTKAAPDYAPAYLSLGVAHESLLNFKQAADGYRKFLSFGIKNKLPEFGQQAEVRQRLLVCERRHQRDVELAKQVPGVWEVSYDRGEEPTTTTTMASEKTSVTMTQSYKVGGVIKLLPDGSVKRPSGDMWILEKNAYWKVVAGRLVVGGHVGTQYEWCNVGTLVPSGHRCEGLTMDLHRTRYVRQAESKVGSAAAAIADWITRALSTKQ